MGAKGRVTSLLAKRDLVLAAAIEQVRSSLKTSMFFFLGVSCHLLLFILLLILPMFIFFRYMCETSYIHIYLYMYAYIYQYVHFFFSPFLLVNRACVLCTAVLINPNPSIAQP